MKPAKSSVAVPQSAIDLLESKGFDILFLSHAKSILSGDFPDTLAEIGNVLNAIELPITEIIGSGGGETKFTQRLRKALSAQGWVKHIFEIGKPLTEYLANRPRTRSIMSNAMTA